MNVNVSYYWMTDLPLRIYEASNLVHASSEAGFWLIAVKVKLAVPPHFKDELHLESVAEQSKDYLKSKITK